MDSITAYGMVISSMPIGEYDRRLEILTGDFGKISVFARGARKPSSPLVSLSRPFAFGEFQLFQGKSSYSVSSAKISNYFTELSKDIELTYYGSYFLELARYFCREAVPALSELKLLYQSLRALCSEKFENRLVRAVFELKLLEIQGLAPQAEYISNESSIRGGTRFAYNFVLNASLEKLFTFRLSEEVLEEFADICAALMAQSTQREFNSLNLLETLV